MSANETAWDSVNMPIREFENLSDHRSDSTMMRWRYQRYLQDYLACIASIDEG